jgi:hypothetical protein
MKRILLPLFIIAASLFATASYSQVYVDAHLRLPVPPLPPIPHIHIRTTPVVVDGYAQPYAPTQQYYNDGYDNCTNGQVVVAQPQVVYGGGYYNNRYYNRYPAEYYRGHEHYRNDYRGYDRGYEHGLDRGHERREEHRRW